jgi:uncharacterized membrane protein YoaK (UPF0700 family)
MRYDRDHRAAMLSAQAYSFHQKSKLAISLSWVGGYTNIVGLLALGTVISHMTGLTTTFGHDAVAGKWDTAAFFGFIVFTFWLGAISSAVMTETARRRGARSKYMVPMTVEAVTLTALAFFLSRKLDNDVTTASNPLLFDQATRYWLCGVFAWAMGLQNATITAISGSVIRTTHVTGVITDLGLEGVQFLLWLKDRLRGRWGRTGRLLRVSQRHPTALRLLLLASILGSFLFGVVAGTYVFEHWPRIVMAPPVAFLLWIVFMDWWRPIADVREIDLLGDPDLKAAGIVHTLLPPELGIYRLAPQHHFSRPPSFQAWAERVHPRARVVILALAPTIRFTDNAVLDLSAASERLRAGGRQLVLCGVTPAQYAMLESEGLMQKIGWENFTPDLEFAISRAVDLLRKDSADVTVAGREDI